ncbi:hypothetical protein AMTR_s00015p00245820 [Amborella trichopoda]|uniref:Uncharacterized protein n=2 Tax=Amborella trichopoda TaxID=13333 RepID=W1PFZ8_AMBTC|nr:hypothetical protein AMTR_s00015p00245820 [Amborella trichopoda]
MVNHKEQEPEPTTMVNDKEQEPKHHKEQEPKPKEEEEPSPKEEVEKKASIWDCDSALYDSFELKSFKRQLDSAIASRSYSMPHFSSQHPQFADEMRQQGSVESNFSVDVSWGEKREACVERKRSSRISRSLNKLLRLVFRPKQAAGNLTIVGMDGWSYMVYPQDFNRQPTAVAGVEPELDIEIISGSARFNGTQAGIPCG